MVRQRPATSTDVARQAGVSQATVSIVLNGARGNIRVSEATRQRILTAAAALGYSPHPAAQALRRQRSGIIGFVPQQSPCLPPSIHPHRYLLGIYVARAATSRGYQVIEPSVKAEAVQSGAEQLQFFAGRRVDGIIYDRPQTAAEVRCLVDYGLPVVQLLRPQGTIGTATVTVDASPGITAAIDHLVGQGHRRIAFLGHGGAHSVERDRLHAFTTALARHGIAVPAERVYLARKYALEEGQTLTRTMLASRPWPTAIFAASDSLALGVLHALYEARIHVPDDLSLVSHDDVLAAQLYPPLTSVAQPFETVAERAVALIVEQVAGTSGRGAETAHVVLPTRLHVRRSTRPPRAGVRLDGKTG